MTEKKLCITIEDGFGRVQTSIETDLSAPQFLDEIMEIDEQQTIIKQQSEEIKKLKKTERSWRKIHCCNEESDNCGILQRQQAIIQSLQDLCGQSDSENAKLRSKNKELQDKIDWLCEKYDYPNTKG